MDIDAFKQNELLNILTLEGPYIPFWVDILFFCFRMSNIMNLFTMKHFWEANTKVILLFDSLLKSYSSLKL